MTGFSPDSQLNQSIPADVFVMNCLTEVGRGYLNYTIYKNKAGHPCWSWTSLYRMPTWSEVKDVMKAFDVWYQLNPITEPHARFGPYSQEFVDECYEKIGKIYSDRTQM
jgi:hypothetical protein